MGLALGAGDGLVEGDAVGADGLADGLAVGDPDGDEDGAAVGGAQRPSVPVRHTSLRQSEWALHCCSPAHVAHTAPPQSTSVSWPLTRPSLHEDVDGLAVGVRDGEIGNGPAVKTMHVSSCSKRSGELFEHERLFNFRGAIAIVVHAPATNDSTI